MGESSAKAGDIVQALDKHWIQPPGTVSPQLIPHPFMGTLDDNLSSDVKIEGRRAAMKDSTARNSPPHVPQGGSFIATPNNQATILTGSSSVKINGRPAARNNDKARTCCQIDPQAGTVIAESTVKIG
jgi:uncharacterized Zn-binding protein involved in type VI secretion